MMTLTTLIFDVDGTLADTEETHRQAFNYAFVEYGLGWDWTPTLYRDLLKVSGGRERIAHYIDTLTVRATERSRLHALVPALHRAKTQLYTELIADGRCPLRPGVRRLLDEAETARIEVAIASTTTSANIDALLSRHLGEGGRYRFAAIACAEHVARKKPAPDIYRLVLSALGRSADECIAIEDSMNGLHAAKCAGVATVVTPSPWTLEQAFDEADIVLPHLGDASNPLPDCIAATLGARWLDLKSLRALVRGERDGESATVSLR